MQVRWHVVDFTYSQMIAEKDASLIQAFRECLNSAQNRDGMTLWSHKSRTFGKSSRRFTFMISPEVIVQAPEIIRAFSFYPESLANLNFEEWVMDIGGRDDEERIRKQMQTTKRLNPDTKSKVGN